VKFKICGSNPPGVWYSSSTQFSYIIDRHSAQNDDNNNARRTSGRTAGDTRYPPARSSLKKFARGLRLKNKTKGSEERVCCVHARVRLTDVSDWRNWKRPYNSSAAKCLPQRFVFVFRTSVPARVVISFKHAFTVSRSLFPWPADCGRTINYTKTPTRSRVNASCNLCCRAFPSGNGVHNNGNNGRFRFVGTSRPENVV